MPEHKRKLPEKVESDLGLEGFENFFVESTETQAPRSIDATNTGDKAGQEQVVNLMQRLSELIALSVDQRIETAKMANQLIENQRQLIATQQILIRLMERSIDLTRHITGIEEKLPAVFELPRMVDSLRARLAEIEGVEVK